jgi:hypothetical protein
MIETHTIRLRGPWQCDVGGRTERVHMPVRRETLVADDYRDHLRLRRRFGCPTCLDPHERVWLVIDQPARSGGAVLNGEELGAFQVTNAVTDFDITTLLKDRNELVLELNFAQTESRSSADELVFKDVRLEIRG